MHIAYLTPEYPHDQLSQSGGLGTSIRNLAKGLVDNGYKATVIVINQLNDKSFNDSGIEVISIKRKGHFIGNWLFERLRVAKIVERIIKSKGIQLIEAPDWTGPSALMKFSVPKIIRFHGSDAYFCTLEQRKQKLKNYLIEKWAIKAADGYIAPTAFAAGLTSEIFHIDKDKIDIIYHGLDLNLFNNTNPRVYKRNTILYFGTVIRKKGVLDLAEIFNKVIKEVPSAKLTVVGGDAPDIKTGGESTLKIMTSKLSSVAKNNFEFLGKVPFSEVKEHVKDAHVCAFPSYAETFGMVTIESMALKKAIVNTNIGWAKELIENGKSGFLEYPSRHDAYSSKIIKLLNNDTLCFELGNEARKRAELKFNINKQVQKNITFYKQMIS